MSNDVVGNLYLRVIDEVINESRADFEDGGIDETTLEELRQVWQQRLTSVGTAKFPWDPALNDPLSGVMSSHSMASLDSDLVKSESIDYSLNGNGSLDRSMLSGTSHGGLVLPGGGQMAQADGPIEIELSLPERGVQSLLQEKNKISQADGPDDDEDINSDLDDSEDELNSAAEDNDEDDGMIMLCLYDKVQRVKSKWKYVLKDGVANINGRDYVFSRGSGESEW